MVPRRLIPLLAVLAILLALPAGAGAVLSGENGRIVFTSGRGSADFDDSEAKIYLRTVPDNSDAGTASATLTPTTGVQHRHATWSPDRTRIAYARGTPGSAMTENFDIYIHDIQSGMTTAITNTGDSLSADRPAWSPDGTRIAYEHQPTDNSTERDIRVHTIANGNILDLTDGAPIETKPAWTPDSQTIYYAMGDINASASDIVREPAGGGIRTPVLAQAGISEFQPSISPDGTQFCVTIGTGFNSSARVWVGQVASPLTLLELSANPGSIGDYNCTWSPDGTLVAYVSGTFTSGSLVMERADNTSPFVVVLENDLNNFDGNPDWAPDGRPTCQATSVDTLVNRPVSVTLRCTDQGPAYELTPVRVSVLLNSPANGTVSGDIQLSPATFLYTPNAGFTGTDSFEFHSFDDFGFGPTVTATVRVLRLGSCANVQTGTNGADTLTGTFAGDRLRGRGGNDRLDGAAGNDCLDGGRGSDRLNAGSGNDVLVGGPGRNAYSAGAGNDRVNARNGRRETIRCGKGRGDRAVVDRSDRVRGCEQVRRR